MDRTDNTTEAPSEIPPTRGNTLQKAYPRANRYRPFGPSPSPLSTYTLTEVGRIGSTCNTRSTQAAPTA